MRFIGKLFLYLIGLIVVLVLVAFALPREISVSRAIAIKAAPEKIFPLANNLKKHS